MKKSVAVAISVAVCVIIAAAVFAFVKTGGFPLSKTAPTDENGEKITTTTLSRTVRVTFPEGYSLVQIAEKLEENGVCDAKAFIEAANDPALYETYSFLKDVEDTEHRAFVAEGYIFPNTYDFYRNEAPESALNRFLKNTEKQITDDMKKRAEELGYTIDEILTIASIIQKEAGILSEMGKVSSVIYNRLGDSYNRLGCDATIHYLNNYVIPYIDGDTDRYNEYYNTYKCYGLPKGPICNPGLDAINAALYPEDTPYKFFVTDKKLNFYYAETYEEHLDNCKKAGLN
ncbi:MAG: endolytic transglycosylase MltG [Acutalibacteraceae bacterium]